MALSDADVQKQVSKENRDNFVTLYRILNVLLRF